MANIFSASLLSLVVILIASPASGQVPGSPKDKAAAPGLIKLTGGDEKRAKELDEQIDKAAKADRWDEAIAKAEELLALRMRVQGPKHFETIDEEWNFKTLCRLAPMTREDKAAHRSAGTMMEQAGTLFAQGKYAQAQLLYEKALEIYRRALTDDHPATAKCYSSLASNLYAQAKYAQAQPLFEKALEIYRQVLTDDHPDTARCYHLLGHNLNAQGKYTDARVQWTRAVKRLDASRLWVAFTGLGRAVTDDSSCFPPVAWRAFRSRPCSHPTIIGR